MPGRWMRRLRALLGKRKLEDELDVELRSHLEREVEQNIKAGISPEEAQLAALRSFGGFEQAKEECRDARGVRYIEEFGQDVRYGVRVLVSKPAFSLILIATLALGIGANAAIFSVINGVLLKSLPFPQPDRIVIVSETSKETPLMSVAYPNYLDWKNSNSVFETMAAWLPIGGVLTGNGEPERIIGRSVSADLFPTLGVQPSAGRFFNAEEDRPGAPRVIVLGYNLWQRSFGGRSEIIGQPLRFNGESWTAIGVLPARFDFYGENNVNNDFFIPLGQLTDQPFMRDRSSHTVTVIARMKPNVTVEQTNAEMRTIAERLSAEFPASNQGNSVAVRSLMDDYVGDIKPALLMLSVAVTIVLLISCANVANLLLARAAHRRKEIALRTALGAGRARIIRQLLTESLLLAAAGGLLGLVLGIVGVQLLIKLDPEGLPRIENITLDWTTVVFTAFVSLLTGIIFGLIPALQTTKTNFNLAIKEGGARTSGNASGWFRNSLIIAEVSLALVLLIGAGLLVKSFWQLMKVDPGFEAQNVLTLRLRLPDAKYKDGPKARAFLEEVMGRVKLLPEAQHVAVSSGFPFGRVSEKGYVLEGQPEPRSPGEWSVGDLQTVSSDYHRVLGVGLLAGRFFNDQDTEKSMSVVIVDEDFVRRHFPQSSAAAVVGKRLRFGGNREGLREIVGVVRHVRQGELTAAGHPGLYQPWSQIKSQSATDYLRAMDLIVKTSTPPLSLVSRIRTEVQAIDRDQPLGNVQALETMVSDSIAPRRFSLTLLGVFAAVALLLGSGGLYGVLSYIVTQRSRELGIRMALGARSFDVLALIIRFGLRLTVIGVALGMVAAFMVAGWLESLLFRVSAKDPLIFTLVPLGLLMVALVSCFIPARRATKVDPLIALRVE